jgi:hypothetical protein
MWINLVSRMVPPISKYNKDYDFSLDLSHISIVEKSPFCGTEK